jgi:DNA-binding helix-turn-helix protein
MLDYAKLIREYRERKFLTQTEFAEQIGVKLVTVCRWETRRFEPNMAMKKKLVGLFKETGMKIDD